MKQFLRLRLEKCGDARFISHLDFMRTLARAFVRADIPVALSQGFNPHPRFSLALALPMGATGEAEFADLELDRRCDALELARRLNRVLPSGIRVRQVQELPLQSPPLESQVGAIRWLLWVWLRPPVGGETVGEEELRRAISDLLARSSLPVTRERGGKTRTLEARPLILSARVSPASGQDTTGGIGLEVLLAVGEQSLRPAEFAALLAAEGGWQIERLRIHRLQVYARRQGELVDPWQLGQEAWRDYHRERGVRFFEE